ncbi:hypothetical protein [Streptomyces adustus]|uniref:hypothetical protein n=1 Tax=Streptomyces adustus TaxID=1609272 RepID=UPI003718C1FB
MEVGEDLPATRAHEVLLHCAMDAACVPPLLREAEATTRIAELDYHTVATVIAWIRAASSRGF